MPIAFLTLGRIEPIGSHGLIQHALTRGDHLKQAIPPLES